MLSSKFVVDFEKREVRASKETLSRASHVGTPEYEYLCRLMERFNSFKVAEDNSIKSKRKTYSNLSLERMEEYIKTQDNAEDNLKRFQAVKRVAKAKNALYPLTKKWFLSNYPDYKDAVTEKEENAAVQADIEAEKELAALEVEETIELKNVA